MVRTIIISGGTSGIGLAAAKILSRKGQGPSSLEEIRNAAKGRRIRSGKPLRSLRRDEDG